MSPRGGVRDGSGRPVYVDTHKLSQTAFRLSADDLGTLDAVAKAEGLANRSDALRWLLVRWTKEQG